MAIKKIGLNFRVSGLCNRLRTLAGAEAAAIVLRLSVDMYWKPTVTCPGTFDGSFVVPPTVRLVESADVRESPVLLDGRWFAETIACNFYPFVSELMSEAEFGVAWKNAARALTPTRRILSVVDAFYDRRWPHGSVVGVHVRRTDLASDLAARNIVLSDDEMFSRLDDLRAGGNRFFLAGDSEEAVRPYLNRYGEDMVCREIDRRPSVEHPRARHTSMEDAVVDLWLLSRCCRIIGTWRSSFSTFAGVVGGVPVERIGVPDGLE